MTSNYKAARMLGWTSLAVGVAELVATDWLEDYMGVDDHKALIRAYGLREIAAGATILSQPGFTKTVLAGLWARVAGDALDLTTLGAAVAETKRPKNLAIVTGIVLGITGLDLLVAARAQQNLHKAKNISKAAKRRVVATEALPHGKAPLTQPEQVEQPASEVI